MEKRFEIENKSILRIEKGQIRKELLKKMGLTENDLSQFNYFKPKSDKGI